MTRFRGLPVAFAIASIIAIPTLVFAQGDQRGSDRTTGSTGAGVRSEGAGAVGRDMGGGGIASGGGGSSSGGSWSGGGWSGGSPTGPGFSNNGFARRPMPGALGAAGRRNTDGGEAGVRSLPWYSRSRGDRPATGTAAGRTAGGSTLYPGGTNYWDWYLGNPMYYYNGGYYRPYWNDCSPMWGFGGFGLGYFYYDPGWWTYPVGGWGCGPYGMYMSGYDSGYVFGYGRYRYGGGYGPGGFGGGYSGGSYGESGLKLKVKPANAQVFVDGYFAGEVDEFDGAFQKLAMTAGNHRIEIRATGYEPLTFDVDVEPYKTVTYKGELQKVR